MVARLLTVLAAFGAAENYKIDPDHTYPNLEFPHMGITTWRGKFTKNEGRVVLDRAAHTGTVEVRTQTASIDFGHAGMHDIAITDDWLELQGLPGELHQIKITDPSSTITLKAGIENLFKKMMPEEVEEVEALG